MAMSKKHYEAIASNFRHHVEHVVASFTNEKDLLRSLAESMAADFAHDNPQFDTKRFIKACGF